MPYACRGIDPYVNQLLEHLSVINLLRGIHTSEIMRDLIELWEILRGSLILSSFEIVVSYYVIYCM